MNYEITTLHEVKIIGVEKQIAFNQGAVECPKFWGEYFETLIKPVVMEGKSPNALQQAVIDNHIGEFALCTCDLPNHNCKTCSEVNFTACNLKSFTYVIGGVYQGGDVPQGMKLYSLRNGYWLKVYFEGGMKAYQQQYTYFHKEWLPQHAEFRVADEASSLEWYSGTDIESPDYACGVMVPLEDLPLIKATSADLEAIEAFYDHVVSDTPTMATHVQWKKGVYPTSEDFEKYIAANALYLYKRDEKIVGAMAVTLSQGEDYHTVSWSKTVADNEVAVVHILAVDPDYQGKGLGYALIRTAILIAKAEGKKAIRLDALASNTPAHRLYEQMGFTFRGKQNLYAANTGWTDFYYFEYDE